MIRLWRNSRKKYLFFLEMLLNAYLAYVTVYVSQLAKDMIDSNINILARKDMVVIFAVVAVTGIAGSFLLEYVKNKYSLQFTCDLKEQCIDSLSGCEYKYIETENSADIMNKLTEDVELISDYISYQMPEFMKNIITFIVCFVSMFLLNAPIALLGVACVPFVGWVTKRFAGDTYDTMDHFYEKLDQAAEVAKDTITNIKVEKAYGMYEKRCSLFRRIMDEAVAYNVEYCRLVAGAGGFKYIIRYVPTLLCILAGYIGTYMGKLSSGEFIASMLLLKNVTDPLQKFVENVIEYKANIVSVQRVSEILDTKPEEYGHGKFMPNQAAAYELSDVSFSYGEQEVLKHMNLTIEGGKMTAIVGESGSGKSTLFKMLVGFYQPSAGEVRLYGRNLKEWDIEAARDLIAYVGQDTWLFHGTVEQNIAIGRAAATMEDVIQAAKMAYAHDFIRKLPLGYQTVLAEQGNNLSGGQRQRIAIARAFLKNAPILLLDEITSALDVESERMIQEAIENYRKGKTVVVIAHRLSTIEKADVRITLEKGGVKYA